MTLFSEDGVDMYSRLRTESVPVWPEIISDDRKVFVMNSVDNTLRDINRFIHFVAKHVLDKTNTDCGDEPDVLATDDSNNTSAGDEVSDVEDDDDDMNMDDMVLSLDSIEPNGSSVDSDEDDKEIMNASIVIFDHLNQFNVQHFGQLLTNRLQLKPVSIYEASNGSEMLCHITRHLSLHMAFNHRLKLVVIYSTSVIGLNPESTADSINQLIASTVITVPVLLVVDRMTAKQETDFLKQLAFDLLSVKTTIDGKHIEIISKRLKNTVIVDIIN